MNNKVSKAIMFYYDSQNGSYKPIDELSGAENIYKYIPKVELYWFDESTNSYKPLVTDGKLPISGSGGGSFDPAILNDYAKKAYVDDSLSVFATQVGNIYATKSYVTTEIGKIDLSNYATKADLDNKVDKIAGKALSTNDYTTADKDKLAGIANGANNYTLPTSSSTVLGGVKIQTNSGLEVTAGGTLSATALKNTVDTHVADNVKHITATERAKWNTVKSPYETSKAILGLGKEFVNWFGDATPITDTYSISVPTIVNQDTAIQLQGLSLPPSLLDKLYIRFYVADKSKLSKITVKASNTVYAEFNRFVVATGWNEIPLNFALGTATNSDNITTLQFQVRGLNVGDNPAVVLHSIGYTNKKNGGATVSLQFDDALSSVYTEAKKILRDNAMVGSIGVIETFVGNAGHMTESQLKEMKMLGWVLFNHTKAHVNMSTYTKQQAKDEVSSTRTYLDTVYGTGIESSYVAYPQGGYNEEVKAGLKELNMVGRALLSRDEILPSINKQETCAFEIGSTTTFEMVKAQIDLAIKHNSHISLLFHKIEAVAGSTISTTTVILRQIIEYIKTQEDSKALRVITVEDLARLELL